MHCAPTPPLITLGLPIAENRLGIEAVCHRLGVPEPMIRAWHLGSTSMPKRRFQLLVDLLTELDHAWVARAQMEWAGLDSNQGPRDYESPALTG